jgi:putative salt-induced outer membrane protein YdiY
MFEVIRRNRVVSLLALCLGVTGVVWAQEDEAEDPDHEVALGMSNSTELSFVLTEGNSNTDALGFKNRYRYIWPSSRYTFRVEATRTNTADDRIAVVDEDLDGGYRIVEFSKSPDVEKYLVENRYDRAITERFFWNVGLAWDRNLDAGIASRWIGFAGVGNTWWDREDLMFNTSYGLSYTDREEVDVDLTKEDTFLGYRFNWEYLNLWGKNTTFENRWTFNGSFADSNDWNSDMTSAISVGINSRLALRVSLQWLYNNIPALQDLDLFVLTADGDLIQVPDGLVQEPKEKLDTIFNTSLVINF